MSLAGSKGVDMNDNNKYKPIVEGIEEGLVISRWIFIVVCLLGIVYSLTVGK